MEPLDALVELCAKRLLEERQELGGVSTSVLLREIALEGGWHHYALLRFGGPKREQAPGNLR